MNASFLCSGHHARVPSLSEKDPLRPFAPLPAWAVQLQHFQDGGQSEFRRPPIFEAAATLLLSLFSYLLLLLFAQAGTCRSWPPWPRRRLISGACSWTARRRRHRTRRAVRPPASRGGPAALLCVVLTLSLLSFVIGAALQAARSDAKQPSRSTFVSSQLLEGALSSLPFRAVPFHPIGDRFRCNVVPRRAQSSPSLGMTFSFASH